MRTRSLITFFVGAALFAVVPYFDSEIPGEGERGELLISVVLGLVVGAMVVLAGALVAAHVVEAVRADRRRVPDKIRGEELVEDGGVPPHEHLVVVSAHDPLEILTRHRGLLVPRVPAPKGYGKSPPPSSDDRKSTTVHR